MSSHGCGCGAKPAPPSTTGTFTTGSGCGGSCGGSCGCTGCGTTRTYVRPRFFAGQLLTEEDLGLLTDYVVAKNRLHNKLLWGEGVVCGLDVTCDPCGDGTVIVQSGYAINCCGDDIVVPCPVRVDILQLVRELRASKLGADCADPCEQPRPLPPPQPDPPPPPPSPDGPILLLAPTRAAAAAPRVPAARYYLYVRYVEEATDPVSPFATDEPCAHLACEPTRIAERFRFELRCERTPRPWIGLWERFRTCIGDIRRASILSTRAVVMRRNASLLANAVDALARQPQPRFVVADHAVLRSATERLTRALAALTRANTDVVRASEPFASTDDRAREAIDATRETGSLVARLAMTPPRERPQDPGTVQPALAALKSAREWLPSTFTGFDELERATAETVLSFVGRWVAIDQPPEAGYPDHLFAYGAAIDDALYTRYRAAHEDLMTFAAAAIAPRRILTDCELRAAFGLLGPLPAGAFGPTLAAILAAQGQTAAQVLLRLLFDCLCDAFNPPCQSCDDPGVLLAEICIRDCVVTDICNMVRRFVITWPNVRYWTDIPNLPLNLNAIGATVERICCELRGALGGGCIPATSLGSILRRVAGDTHALARLEGPIEIGPAPASEEAMFGTLFSSLERLAGAALPEPPPPRETTDTIDALRRDVEALRRELAELRH
ncbi:MAG: hypothetical protein ACKV2T_31855 [Kofleriaceae bacterium]